MKKTLIILTLFVTLLNGEFLHIIVDTEVGELGTELTSDFAPHVFPDVSPYLIRKKEIRRPIFDYRKVIGSIYKQKKISVNLDEYKNGIVVFDLQDLVLCSNDNKRCKISIEQSHRGEMRELNQFILYSSQNNRSIPIKINLSDTSKSILTINNTCDALYGVNLNDYRGLKYKNISIVIPKSLTPIVDNRKGDYNINLLITITCEE